MHVVQFECARDTASPQNDVPCTRHHQSPWQIDPLSRELTPVAPPAHYAKRHTIGSWCPSLATPMCSGIGGVQTDAPLAQIQRAALSHDDDDEMRPSELPAATQNEAACIAKKLLARLRIERMRRRLLHPITAGVRRHSQRDCTPHWGETRRLQCLHTTSLLTIGSRNELKTVSIKGGVFTEAMARRVDELVLLAARQAVLSINSRLLHTAHPFIWSCALGQQAFFELNDTYTVTTEAARHAMSWVHFAKVLHESVGMTTEMVESDDCATQFHPPVMRRTTAIHDLGDAKQLRRKVQCLDTLLRASDHTGLHRRIIQCLPPLLQAAEQDAASTRTKARQDRALHNHSVYGR